MLKSDKLSNSYIWVLNRFISSDCKTTASIYQIMPEVHTEQIALREVSVATVCT